MKKYKIKLLVVDLYGVISRGSYRNICRYLAKKYKKNWKELYDVFYWKYFSKAVMGEISEANSFKIPLTQYGFKENWKEVRGRHLSYLILNKQVFELIKQIQDRGYTILILSKNVPSQLRDTVRNLGLKKHFPHIVNTFDLGLPKASSETIRWILKKFKVKPKEVIFIDEQKPNLVHPKKMGLYTILYKNFRQFKKDLVRLLNQKV